MRPFSLRRMLKLTFVSCQPIRSRSKKPRRRTGAGNDPSPVEDGTVGGGDHMETGRPSGAAYINPSEGRPSRETDRVGSHISAAQVGLECFQEKLLKRTANTRAPAADETLLAGLEEARENALEMAQEADAPPQERAEDASAVSHHLHRRGGGPPFRVDSTDENWSVAFHVLGETIDGRDAQRIPDRAIRSARRQPRIRAVAQRHEDRLPAHRTRDP